MGIDFLFHTAPLDARNLDQEKRQINFFTKQDEESRDDSFSNPESLSCESPTRKSSPQIEMKTTQTAEVRTTKKQQYSAL